MNAIGGPRSDAGPEYDEEYERLMDDLCHLGMEDAAKTLGRVLHPKDPRRVFERLWGALWNEAEGLDPEDYEELREAIKRPAPGRGR